MDLLTHTIAALVGGGAVYLWMRGKLADRDLELWATNAAYDQLWQKRADLQSELDRLTDRDELGRYKKDDPQ